MNPLLRYRDPTSKHRPDGVLLAITVVLSLAAFLTGSPAFASEGTGSLMPPGNVYTCPWIAAHPVEAQQAQVTCDRDLFMGAMSSVGGASTDAFTPLDNGSNWVPNVGFVGQGVFAWTSYKYTVYWDFAACAGCNPPPGTLFDYTWYVQKPGDITVDHARVFDQEWYQSITAANNHRWGAQNHASKAEHWYVYWQDHYP